MLRNRGLLKVEEAFYSRLQLLRLLLVAVVMLIYLSPRMRPNQSNAICPRSAATNLALAVVAKSSKNVVAVQLEQ